MASPGWTSSKEELLHLLNLTQVRGVGSLRIRALVARFPCPSAVFSASPAALAQVLGIDSKLAAEIRRGAKNHFGEIQYQRMEAFGARILTIWDSEYPALLKRIDDAPVLLFVKGELDCLHTTCIAIVGTRAPSQYGRQVTEKLVAQLVEKGITITSGFARGIDTVAHAAAIQRGGRTVGVLGCGLDIVYPAENRELGKKLIECGALVTEFAFGTKPDATNFPRRNRIISGLSHGTLVVEARERSGALITAYQALEQNREVFAVPGSVFSPLSKGPHRLIQEGAKLVNSVQDILDELPRQEELFPKQTFQPKKPIDGLSAEEQKILDHLSHEPVHIDRLSLDTAIPSGPLLSQLLLLEFKGVVRQLPGKLFMLA